MADPRKEFTKRKRAIPYQGLNQSTLVFGSDNTGIFPPTHTSGGSTDVMDTSPWNGTQVTESLSHPSWRRRPSGSRFKGDVGGNFFSQRRYMASKPVKHHLEGEVWVTPTARNWARYDGPMLPKAPHLMPMPPFINPSSNSSLDAWGAKAIARCKPTNAIADVSVALGEILFSGGIPKLTGSAVKRWQDGTRKARNVPGDEYLNVEFGWKPMIREITNVMLAIDRADAIMAQYERDSGRMVRRKYEFPIETSVSSTVLTNRAPFTLASSGALNKSTFAGSQVISVRKTEIRRWFSGAFTYYLPGGYDARSEMTRRALLAKKILGLSLTPETLWNLSPWSWAVDWFSSTGDVVSNLSDWKTDGLVLRYGYMMEHSVIEDTHTYVGDTGFQSSAEKPDKVVLVSETKVRRRATPFGFGLTWNGLTPRQLAIAAALGLSRS